MGPAAAVPGAQPIDRHCVTVTCNSNNSGSRQQILGGPRPLRVPPTAVTAQALASAADYSILAATCNPGSDA
jgi:hypothetical protein